MANKLVFSSRVESAYEKQKILSSVGISKNALYCTPLFLIMALFSTYMSITDGEPFWGIVAIGSWIFFAICLFIAFIIISAIRREKSNEQQVKRILAKEIDGEFYNKCVSKGYSDLSKRSNIEKIYNIAKAEGYTESKEEILELFKNMPILLAELEREEKIADERNHLREIVEAEKKFEEENRRYINFKGIDKPRAIIDAKIAELRQQKAEINSNIKTVNNGTDAYYSLNKQHEPNWATHGGIASALGGTAAGVSVAVDVAQRSAAAKAYNQELKQNASMIRANLNASNYYRIADIDNEIEKLQKSKQDLDILLVEEIPENKLLKYISPKVLSKETTESGAINMRIQTQASTDFLIYDDVPAVVDGSIKVLLMNGNEVAGTAYFSLPFSGSEEQSNVSVVCREVNGTVTEILFEPYHLWAIERINKKKAKKTEEKTTKNSPNTSAPKQLNRNTPLTNEEIKSSIIRSMEPGQLYTVTDIMNCCSEASALTTTRVSALLRQLMPARIERVEESGRAYFKLK